MEGTAVLRDEHNNGLRWHKLLLEIFGTLSWMGFVGSLRRALTVQTIAQAKSTAPTRSPDCDKTG